MLKLWQRDFLKGKRVIAKTHFLLPLSQLNLFSLSVGHDFSLSYFLNNYGDQLVDKFSYLF